MKKQKALYNQIRGLITDVNINVNAGNPTFKNFTLTSIGKLEKRKGWSLIRSYDEGGKDISNIVIDYNRLNTGVSGYPNITCFHLKPYTTVVNGIETTYKDVLVHRIVDNVNELWRIRYDINDNIVAEVKISTPSSWTGKGNIRFIETPDHLYIVNDYTDGAASAKLYKYRYNKKAITGDTDIIMEAIQKSNFYVGINSSGLNTTVSGKTVDIIPVACNYTTCNPLMFGNNKGISGAGTGRLYMFLPIYNTGSLGSPLLPEINGNTNWDSYITQGLVVAVDNPLSAPINAFLCKRITDPFITGIRVYRTKAVDPANTNSGWNTFFHVDDFYKPGADPTDTTGATLTYTREQYLNGELYYWMKFGSRTFVSTLAGTPTIYADDVPDSGLNTPPENIAIANRELEVKNARIIPAATIGVSCGCYAQNRFFAGGDLKFPASLYVSVLDRTDTFDAGLSFTLELANNDNKMIAIEEVGSNIYIFCKHSIYVLRPTQDPEAPFTKELISPTIGCDSLNSIAVLEGIAYFMFNNKLMALNAFGQYNEVSIPVNSKLNNLDTASPCEVIIKANASDRYIKIMYRDTDNKPVNINYCPVTDIFEEEEGYKDIFTVSGSTATLTVKDDRYGLLNYEQIPDLKEEWGVDVDGNIVKRATDYVNTSIGGDKQGWIDYPTVVKSQEPIKTYTVESIIDKPFVFASRVLVNSVTLYGLGDIDVAWSIDDGAFSGFRTVTMTRTGIELPLNRQGFIINVRLRHNKNENVDYDYMEVKYTAQTSVDIRNNVTGGTAV